MTPLKKQHLPKWKYWLSHLFEIHIESAPSALNPHLYVSLKNGKLLLGTQNAVYSFEDRYDNFRLLFNQIELGQYSFKRALILGLGLGSVPLLIEKSGARLSDMVLVEIDEKVIYLAEKYALHRLITPYTTYCTNAESFVQLHQEQYDFVVSDVFLDDVIPAFFRTPAYLEHLKRLLSVDGLLIINTLASTAQDRKQSNAYFEEVFKSAFPQGEMRHVWENYMLLNRTIR